MKIGFLIRKIVRVPYYTFNKFKKKSNLLINKLFFRVTRKELLLKLKKIGLKRGDVVYIHSSISSFGYIQGGADAVLNIILKLIGDKGTIVIPSFTHKTDVFDFKNTKCWTGKLSENLRLRRDSFRSIHPTHSVVAFGPLAEEITKSHEKSKAPFDENSPFHKIAKRKSYILMLGTENNSMIHYVQNKINFPNLFLDKLFECKYLINGKIKSMKTKLHHPNGSIKYICNSRLCTDVQFLVKMYKDEKFNENNYMKTIKIGKAVCHLIDTQNFVRIATKYLKNNIKKYKEEYSSLIKNG